MEIRQIQYFMAVAEQLSFSKAAAVLYVTQPLLSQQIADLEHQMGADLFIRNKRSVSLTPAGQAFYQEAKGVMEQVNKAANAVRNAIGGVGTGGELSFGYEHVYPRRSVTEIISRFRYANPNVSVRADKYSANNLLFQINSGSVDVGFFTFPYLGVNRDFEMRILDTTPLALVSSTLIAPEDNLEDIRRMMSTYPIYQMSDDTRGLSGTLKACEDLMVEPVFFFANQMDQLLTYVESGMGYAILARNVLDSYGGGHLSVIELDRFINARVCNVMAWLKNNANPMIPVVEKIAAPEKRECQGECAKLCTLNPNKDIKKTAIRI